MDVPSIIVKHYLLTVLDKPVYLKVPLAPDSLFVRIDQGAPQRINLAQYQTTIIIQVYGKETGKTLDLISQCAQLMEGIEQDPRVSAWVEESGPVEFPDPDTNKHRRWQFVGKLFTTLA